MENHDTKKISEEINRLKKERNAVLLCHYYQSAEIQKVADFLGDSLELSRKAKETDADIILFAGVHFMAETASILSPDKKVLIPVPGAGCTLADSITAEDLRKWKARHEDGLVVSYVNTSAEVKAETDYCVTSANAVKIVSLLPKDRPILFCPDRYLGRHIQAVTGRELELWPGACYIHKEMDGKLVKEALKAYPAPVELLIHPETVAASDPDILSNPRCIIGSTSTIIKRPAISGLDTYIVGTEIGIITELERRYPDKKFVPLTEGCVCKYMRKISLRNILEALRDEKYEVKVPDEIRERAIVPIERMLSMS